MTDENSLDTREIRAARLKERIYVTFVALAVVLSLRAHGSEVQEAFVTLAVTVLGTVLAVFVADLTSHIVVHERGPTAHEVRVVLVSSFGAITSVFLTFVFLGVSAIGLWPVETALTAAMIALIASLVLSGWVAVRHLPLTWWQRLVALGGEALLGLAVIGLQLTAHGG
ncbi:hypothetical protein [Homoserinibacter sp. GY 40078]|uniref:hypothetical protein n=1 Tax=Homoserinibacter sp. GY 40078 TaxID=2603275 RepID=UPI0011C99F01|nr:hypothetical protein [Homoserinibacter sp. GY 40078]TXK18651.1 hypothetical protein FVQ89_01505 [Homoserinibacter sp. GY 40078]